MASWTIRAALGRASLPRVLGVLGVAALAGALAVASCSPGVVPPSNPCDDPYGTASPSAETYDEHAAERASCAFTATATTDGTVGASAPQVPGLEHVVVLMLENRSFDHYFSDLADAGIDADTAGYGVQVPTDRGGTVTRQRASKCSGQVPGHEWSDAHLSLAGGCMDGFFAAGGCAAMGYYTHEDLPLFYALASNFAISDRYFSPVLGPTWPNRLFFLAGTSCGYAEGFDTNVLVTFDCGATQPNLLDLLDRKHVGYGVYDDSGPFSVIVGLGQAGIPQGLAAFEAKADAGTLERVTLVGANTGESPFAGPGEDDHPPADIERGQAFVARVLAAIAGPNTWGSTALFITYDEWGGYFDHVKPPRACPPDADAGPPRDYAFDQYGFRVPLILVSPFAKRGYVSHVDADHTSITRFIEHWLGLGALTGRDANAWPLLDLFDYSLTGPRAMPALPTPAPSTSCPGGLTMTCP